MKIKLTDNELIERPYPKLMVNTNNNLIVYMYGEGGDVGMGSGVTLYVDNSTPNALTIGQCFDDWLLVNFTDFKGSLTLSND